jgi:lipopolysaccharide transport system ATP-binding protein
MSDVALRIEGLGKRYRLGRRERYRSLRDTLARAVRAPQRWLGRPQPKVADAGGTFWALKDVDFEVRHGEVVGVIGRNGAGKSTLLKILSRVTEPTTGQVELYGRVGSLLEVGTGFHPELTGRENIFLNGAILGMTRGEIARKFDEIVAFAEVSEFLDTPVKHYSSGMYMRLAFAVAAHLEPEILVVDEVLAVGDAAFQKKCLGKMGEVARAGRTVLFVSHNMGAVANLCSTGVFLERGSVKVRGDVRAAIDAYNATWAAADADTGRPAHCLYDKPDNAARHDCAITRVEVLDQDRRPKPVVCTGDAVVLRFHFHSRSPLQAGSVVFEVSPRNGPRLWILSTQPDGTLPLPFRAGPQWAECEIPELPLAAGDYVVGAGLAVPFMQTLWHEAELGQLTVLPADYYGSGWAPAAPRSLVAVKHRWVAPE